MQENAKYNPGEIEPKWQEFWAENLELSEVQDDSDKPKFYCLDMFPYPSGAGLHVGHVENYTATDIYSRFKRMTGFNVLHPMGWDAFGLPAENFAIKNKIHPDKSTHDNIKNFTSQIKRLGMSYDWSREIDTSSPEYYRWTQWFFLFLYKNGLAYKKKAKANWCESCKTVVANEQVVNGKCERCGGEIVQKDLDQWFFKITDFIEDVEGENGKINGLISGLDKIDWPNSTAIAQKNWIGKSEGTIVKFGIMPSPVASTRHPLPSTGEEEYIEVFTTRVDTIFGCTYVVLAPESKLASELKNQSSNIDEIEKYIADTKKKTDLERMESKEKTGVVMQGVMAINPFNDAEVPVYVADYVIGTYGTGAVMAVPAHDERDFEFAKKYDLPITQSIMPSADAEYINGKVFIEDGVVVNSDMYSGLSSAEAREKMTVWLEENNKGEKKVNYRLRDWLVSRQRYWGAPIPIIYCEKCGEVPVPEKDLPVMLPTDVDFKPTGESPLAISKSFHEVVCPLCGAKSRRESDTMDTFVCSSWYYLRFADPKNDKEFADKKNLDKWLPVDLYMGGAEHTVLHLLYARFFTKALAKFGYLDFDEPFLKLRHQGMIMAEDGRKMSKSLGNVVNPDEVVEKFGADALRLYEMFMGPIEEMKAWSMQNVNGPKNFLDKVWKTQLKVKSEKLKVTIKNSKLESLIHKTIKKVGADIESFRFNTAISALMILINEMEKQESVSSDDYGILVTLLAPFAPHIAEEIWQEVLGHKESIFLQSWPEFDEALTQDNEINLVLQVNGRVRDMVEVSADITEEDAKALALASEKIKNHTAGKEVKKIIFVKGKLVNIVISS